MVVSLGPGKFYGSSLPRPWIYTDVKFSADRVDPPVPVTDPLMTWANKAHWSMGGLSFNHLRLQGKIEGNVNKLRAERENLFKIQNRSPAAEARSYFSGSESKNVTGSIRAVPVSPVATKRRRFLAVIEEEGAQEEEIETRNCRVRSRLVKKLGDDFDGVALENERSDLSETGNEGKNQRLEISYDDDDDVVKVVEKVNKSNFKGKKAEAGKNSESQYNKNTVSANGDRTSPRLTKHESS